MPDIPGRQKDEESSDFSDESDLDITYDEPTEEGPSHRAEGEPEVTAGKVLLLTFQHHDLWVVREETKRVKRNFRRLKYSIDEKKVPMKDSPQMLRKIIEDFLPEEENEESRATLYIIYYNGHGYLNTDTADGKFTLMSHNFPSPDELCDQVLPRIYEEMGRYFEDPNRRRSPREQETWKETWKETWETIGNFQPIAEVAWGDISDTIMDAPCNTLVILDCCNAGLASAMARGEDRPRLRFRKELLGACSWGNATQDRMSPALCKVLKSIPRGGAISVWTMVRKMNDILARQFVRNKRKGKEHVVPQAIHYVLARTARDRIILNNLKAPRDE